MKIRTHPTRRTWLDRARAAAPKVFAAGFVFFLVKGLIWLGIGAAALLGVLSG